jgi:hypothetical protein
MTLPHISMQPPSRLAAIALLAAPPAGIILTAALLFFFPPAQYHFYPQCPIHQYFHLDCPGCGATRALAALLHGHLLEALRLNTSPLSCSPSQPSTPPAATSTCSDDNPSPCLSPPATRCN